MLNGGQMVCEKGCKVRHQVLIFKDIYADIINHIGLNEKRKSGLKDKVGSFLSKCVGRSTYQALPSDGDGF